MAWLRSTIDFVNRRATLQSGLEYYCVCGTEGEEPDMRRLTKDSLAYTLVFAIGYFVACSSTTKNITNSTGNSSVATARMLNSKVRHAAIFPTNTGTQAVLASIFGFDSPVNRHAAIANPSDLGQSFEVECYQWGTSPTPPLGIHAAFGNSGLVPMMDPRSDAGLAYYFDCSAPIASVGADENGHATGFPILLPGTINNLVAYGILVSGNNFRCLDTSNTSSIQDNTFVRPYYDLAHDAVIIGSGTTQLALTCSISIPPGDDVAKIRVQWIKN
jgi:hypothetical protein